jgi:hypothetical protein
VIRGFKIVLLFCCVAVLGVFLSGSEPWDAQPWMTPVWGDIVDDDVVSAFRFSVTVSGADTFTMPLVDDGNSISCNVDWGDGGSSVITAWDDSDKTHSYSGAGTYDVIVTGTLSGWKFNNTGDKTLITEISEWGMFNASVAAGFYGCNKLEVTATDAPLITSTSLSVYFRGCSTLDDIGYAPGWDVSGVSNFSNMFHSSSIDSDNDLSRWNMSAAKDISLMFVNFYNGDIGNWDVSSVTDMNFIFAGNSSFNQDLDSWDVSACKIFSNAFNGANAMRQGFPSWDLSAATDLGGLMVGAAGLSTTEYDSTLVGWYANENTPDGINTHFGGSTFSGDSLIVSTTTGDGAGQLIDTAVDFSIAVDVGDAVYNSTDQTWALVVSVSSPTILAISVDIMDSAEGYRILQSGAAKAKAGLISAKSWTITDNGELRAAP